MKTWLLVNLALSALAVLFLALNRDAPYRLRFHISLVTLCAWLIPWQFTGTLLPASIAQPIFTLLPATSVDLMPGDLTGEGAGISLFSSAVIALQIAFAAGAVLFLRSLWHHQQFLRRLESSRTTTNISLADLPVIARLRKSGNWPEPLIKTQSLAPGAFTTGLFRPTIWLHENLVRTPELETVLLHELVHIRQHDSAYLMLLTFLEKLFWWNPVCLLLARYSRKMQELSCDALCAREHSQYRACLSSLIIKLSDADKTLPRSLSLGAGIFNNPTFNVERIRRLKRSHTMKAKHYISIALLGLGGITSIAVSQQSTEADGRTNVEFTPPPQDEAARREYIARERAEWEAGREERQRRAQAGEPSAPLTEKDVRIGLEVYAESLEQAYDDLLEQKAQLEARVEELEQQSQSVPGYGRALPSHERPLRASEDYRRLPALDG